MEKPMMEGRTHRKLCQSIKRDGLVPPNVQTCEMSDLQINPTDFMVNPGFYTEVLDFFIALWAPLFGGCPATAQSSLSQGFESKKQEPTDSNSERDPIFSHGNCPEDLIEIP